MERSASAASRPGASNVPGRLNIPSTLPAKASPTLDSSSSVLASLIALPTKNEQPPLIENEAERLRALPASRTTRPSRRASNAASSGVGVLFSRNPSLLGRLTGSISFRNNDRSGRIDQRRLNRSKSPLKSGMGHADSGALSLMSLFSPSTAKDDTKDGTDALLDVENVHGGFASPYDDAEDVKLNSSGDLPHRDLSDPNSADSDDTNNFVEMNLSYVAPEVATDDDDESDSDSDDDQMDDDAPALLEEVERGKVATTHLTSEELLQMIELDDAPDSNILQSYAPIVSDTSASTGRKGKTKMRSKTRFRPVSKWLWSLPPPFRISLPLFVECLPSMIISIIALVLAGYLLEVQERSFVFEKLPALTVLVPILLNLKGNLELNLAARLGSETARGNLKFGFAGVGVIGDRERANRSRVMKGNLLLLQLQAVVMGALAGVVARVFVAFTEKDSPNVTETMIIITSSVLAASVTAFVTGLLMIGLVVLAQWLKCDPDNVLIPVAAALGDLATLLVLGFSGQFLLLSETFFVDARGMGWASGLATHAIFAALALSAVPCFILVLKNQHVRHAITPISWLPFLVSVGISCSAGLLLEKFVGDFEALAVLVPILNGGIILDDMDVAEITAMVCAMVVDEKNGSRYTCVAIHHLHL
ncbi:hypothetical protein M427DRAFT_496663 [Gonapodya prolifera JEL478]|uniref:SLC41A/MgtE integral membrane domain-containing protein n=1 Tax=Gonapodya prolifera (strain JEL478) TaxID=1344416 RepID=A0A139AX44_GONPJ|nr:hypothetical protein M427DRAFT_496663 [Gonapodya prolifera JEL478]|eukprot:KXS21312.1 hypothetical protein M427DRAFT_496663 [Gonapodya prolifera JEL478]